MELSAEEMNNIPNQRIVILGAAGFIGYHISNRLKDFNHFNLVLIDNFARSNRDDEFNKLILSQNVTFMDTNLSHPDSYANLFQNGDIVINCAAFNGTNNFYKNPVEVIRNSAVTAIFAAEYSARAKVSKYFYFGSAESYAGGVNLGLTPIPTPENVPLIIDNPHNVRWSYGASKTLGEIATVAIVSQFGINAKIFRVHNIYGPRMGFDHVVPDLVRNFIANNFQVHGVNESRAFMYVDDLVSIIVKFVCDDEIDRNLTYNIGSSQEINIQNLAELILEVLGINHQISSLPNLDGSVLRRIPDTSLLRSRFKYSETELKEGIRRYISWYRSQL